MEFDNKDKRHGKQINQKLKSLLVWNYLCRNTDENHFASAQTIVDYLKENGIFAERRSIYTDVEQLNVVLYMIENDCSLEEAEEDLGFDEEASIIKYQPKKGYFIKHQNYDFDTIRLLAESVYSARFVDDAQMGQLIEVITNLVSSFEAEKIEHSVLNIDHTRTANTQTFFSVGEINQAMSTKLEGQPHAPEKISFKYLKYSINDMKQTVAKRGGEEFIVSPYKLIISDGNYYLRCFEDKSQKMKTFRVDRMKDVKRLGLPRDGKEESSAEDYKSYTKRVFSMFGGEKTYVKLLFINSLLDAVIERFGNDKLKYHKVDEHHFSVLTEVEISPQFFSWLCGFGSSVQILEPQSVKEEYLKHLQGIIQKYSKEK